MTQRAIVDLPQPDSPTTPSVSPSLTVKLTPSTAFTAAIWRWKKIPWVTGKCFLRSSTTSSSSGPHEASAIVPARSFAASRSLGGVIEQAGLRSGPDRPARARARGSIVGHLANAYGQRGWNRQPLGGRSSDGGCPAICTSRSTSVVEPRQRAEQAPRVGVRGCLKISSTLPLLDDLGRVHHDDVVGDLGDHAEVVRDHDDRAAELLLQPFDQRQDLRLRGHVERRRRLVGDQEVGIVDQRHRDHHALAHAARELVRVVVDASLGARDADGLEQLEARGPGLRAWTRPGAGAPPRRAGSPMVCTGFSEVIGSWKIIAISLPRTPRSSRRASSSAGRGP